MEPLFRMTYRVEKKQCTGKEKKNPIQPSNTTHTHTHTHTHIKMQKMLMFAKLCHVGGKSNIDCPFF